MRRQWVLIALLGGFAAAQAADVYKWVDANGVMHYSDTAPPPDTRTELVHLRGTGSAAAVPAAIEDDSANTENPRKPAAAEKNTLASAVVTAEKRCADARATLEVLQGSGPVGLDTGGKGAPKALDDNERQRRISAAQSVIATYCK